MGLRSGVYSRGNMAFSRNKAMFSSDGEYFAYSSPDGCLRIWETSSNLLKQEYTPSSHLSSTCSSLAWGPCKHSFLGQRSKKSKIENQVFTAVRDLQLIAMGTLTGDVLLYSVANGDLHTQLTEGHCDAVNGISWFAEEDSLFSCSNDQHIVIWTVSTGKIKKKWKADKNPIYSICVIDKNNMLSASDSILWWNIQDQTVIKKFSGHATEVFQLLPINLSKQSDYRYFISSAVGDRIINAWQLNENNSKKSVVSFCLADEPEVIELTQTSSKDQPLQMAAVTKEGSFHLFEHVLNGKVKKPLQPKVTIHIVSNTNSSTRKPYPIPILSAKFSRNLESCIIVYGNFIKPIFEKVEIPKDHQKIPIYLFRDISLPGTAFQDGVTRIKHPDRSEAVKYLAPGHMTPSKSTYSATLKRKKKGLNVADLPLQERLNSLSLTKSPEIEEPTPETNIKSDSMAHLLMQGLQSQDQELLSTVLQCGDEALISNTLKQLPIQCISLVIKELYYRLHKQENRNHPCIRWLKGVFSTHLPYLMSCESTSEYLGRISQLIEARTEPLYKLSFLKSSLETLLSHSNLIQENTLNISTEAMASYRSESSEESDSEEDNLNTLTVTEHVEDLSSEESDSSSNSENHMEL